MQKERWPQPLPRDARMMHARTRLARKVRTIPLPPLFTLPCFSENCQSSGTGPLKTVEHHRLKEMSTGHWKYPSVADEATGPGRIAGRHWILPVGRKFLQNLVFDSNKNRQCMAWNFKQVYAWPLSQSCNGLKGVCPSTLGPSITHDGLRGQVLQLWYQMKCKHKTHQRAPTPIMIDQEARDACSMKCNLGMEAKYATWTCKWAMYTRRAT